MSYDIKQLRRRLVEIDFTFGHRHLPGSLSALEIIAEIYDKMDAGVDVFILSKGHSCASLYAVLESRGKHPDCSLVHPERNIHAGVEITSGSLGHGLPIAVGQAWAKKLKGEPGTVHVLLGDGECQEGSVWEALLTAEALCLSNLVVHIDFNGYQGSDASVNNAMRLMHIFDDSSAFPVILIHRTSKGAGIKMFEDNPVKSVHLVSEADYAAIIKELE